MRFVSVLMFSAFLLLSGCNVATTMKDMTAKQKAVQEAIQQKTGLQTQVGWLERNGQLAQITVAFEEAAVGDKKVSELETSVKEAIQTSFQTQPQVLCVQILTKKQ